MTPGPAAYQGPGSWGLPGESASRDLRDLEHHSARGSDDRVDPHPPGSSIAPRNPELNTNPIGVSSVCLGYMMGLRIPRRYSLVRVVLTLNASASLLAPSGPMPFTVQTTHTEGRVYPHAQQSRVHPWGLACFIGTTFRRIWGATWNLHSYVMSTP